MTFGFIGMPLIDQRRYHADHLSNMIGRPRFDIRGRNIERGTIFVKRGNSFCGQRVVMPSSAARALILSSTSVMLRA